MSIIRAERLTKKFNDLIAVNDLTFSVEEGEIFGMVGPDGAGKTTTMRLLSAILDPTSGSAFVSGFDTVSHSEEIKELIGTMTQKFGLYHDLTVLQNMEFYAEIYGVERAGRQEAIDRLLEFSQLLPFKDRIADKLSGGMKQKLGLACALIHKPKLLLLDEPTNGVDPVSRRDFWKILYRLHRENVTIFFTTSYMDEADRASRLAFMHQGNVLACGKASEVKELFQGHLLQMHVNNPREVFAKIRSQKPQVLVRLVGNKLQATSDDFVLLKRQMREFFIEQNLGSFIFEKIDPSLEDVFASIIKSEQSH